MKNLTSNCKSSHLKMAEYAYKCVEKVVQTEVQKGEEKFKENYKSYAKKLPTLIHVNGLGHALSFAFSKGFKIKDGKMQVEAWGELLYHVVVWMRREEEKLEEKNPEKKKKEIENFFQDKLLKANSFEYRQYEREIIALLNWIKRFAEALILKEGEA